MINAAIETITDMLNEYYALHFDQQETVAVARDLHNSCVKSDVNTQNKIIVSLVKIKTSSAVYSQNRATRTLDYKIASPLHLELSVLISANFSQAQYTQGLQVLSDCMRFLHNNAAINRDVRPQLSDKISKLILEIENLEFDDAHHLWTILGSHYLPSALYKVRVMGIENSPQSLSL